MILTDPEIMIVEATRDRFLRRCASWLGWGGAGGAASRSLSPAMLSIVAQQPVLDTDLIEESSLIPATIDESLPPTVPARGYHTPRVVVLTSEERRARAIALRGLSQSRCARFDAAAASFEEAVVMDPALDLAKLPDFWKLPQQALQAAVEAYERVGRARDAAQLTAEARTMFQPKLVRARRVA